MIERVNQAAEQELAPLRERARAEGWDEDRIEQEKVRFELSHEVTLCSRRGCLRIAARAPGFRELACPEHR
jgi:hypothetical protein